MRTLVWQSVLLLHYRQIDVSRTVGGTAQSLIADRGTGYRKVMSLRGGRKPDVAIRSKNVSIILEFSVKTVVFKDADCHVATLLAMTFRNLMPFS